MSANHLTPERREIILDALLCEPTQKKAAIRAGISPRTLSRYLIDPNFASEYAAVRAELRRQIRHMRLRGVVAGWDALVEVAEDVNANAADRIGAANALRAWEESNRKWDQEKAILELQAAVARLHSAASTSPEACSAGGPTSTPPNALA